MKTRKYRIYQVGKSFVIETKGEAKAGKFKNNLTTVTTAEGEKIPNVIMLTEVIEQEVVKAAKQDEEDVEEV